jgi:chromosome segregation ATPase
VTTPEGLPHKVSQIRHDLDDLYELMSQVQQSQTRTESVLHHHGNRLAELQQSLDLHSGRFDRVGGRLDRIEDNQHQAGDRLDRIEDNQHQAGDRLDRIEDNQRQQFDHLSAQMTEILSVLHGPATAEPASDSE